MAELTVDDVVDQSLSVGDLSPSDVPATTPNTASNLAGEESSAAEVALKENGIHNPNSVKIDELEDASVRSDTDTSRAEGSVGDDKPNDSRPVKKFAASKPLSFAKYSVPKVIAANAAVKGTDKAPATPSSSTSSLLQAGRSRLVAKTTSSLQQKAKAYKPVAPDPMQVWNKNRVTPQPSTKHLTDEELKQQYGIHLTSRLQADGEGKEAKWADIDDDEDDWAPETIEWNDGTKTTLASTDVTPAPAEKQPLDPSILANSQEGPSKAIPPQFASSVGPNAVVLKVGASVERQQAQKAAAEKARSPSEKPRPALTNSAPAPAPSKSPWAALPPVDKMSPIPINPQPMAPPPARFASAYGYAQTPANMTAPSPATEISADDFNRAWRDAPSNQPQQLYMPNSGRYEAVPEGRRRMSKNEQNFRAPAVLQRPSQSDPHAPAEPSAAFQTHRTSADVTRRRASSTISGGSGQFARRMSIKSGDAVTPVFDSQPPPQPQLRPSSQDGPSEAGPTPTTYHARGSTVDSGTGPIPAQYDIEAQREKQRAEMKQRIELARKRKEEEQAKEEAEKQERIRQKLASLAPLPQTENPAGNLPEPQTPAMAEHDTKKPLEPSTNVTSSPPKPPQPLATGAPQQYGMMKVHPMDTVNKYGAHSATNLNKPRDSHDDAVRPAQPSSANGRPSTDNRRQLGSDTLTAPEPSPKLSKPLSAGADARNGWGDLPDQRAPHSSNLWGMPSNKALGNGTFDQTLAGYAPQDLSRASSTAQGWMGGRTPTSGRSPQPQYVNQHVPEDRPQLPTSLISPEATPLAADSEADNLFPTVRPAPIGPPPAHPHYQQPQVNGVPQAPQMNGAVAAWNNFHQVAGQQERSETEKYQRDLAARREEETRTGVRQAPQYTFNETWKQVQVGDQAGQRQVAGVTTAAASFGAVGQPTRGSRFFPQNAGGMSPQQQRAVTYSHPEVSRSPSPPPAEEYGGYHPAYDGDKIKISIRMPPSKPVVNLPPAMPPTPPLDEPNAATTAENLSWAARVSMPAPASTASLRSVSTPIAQTSSWQERFNGLLGKKPGLNQKDSQIATPSLAVTSSTREPLDVIAPAVSAAVSMPRHSVVAARKGAGLVTSKSVEAEEDLFEDRELASLPTISLPLQSLVSLPVHSRPTKWPMSVESSTIGFYHMVNNPTGKPPMNPVQFAMVKIGPQAKSIRRDLPQQSAVGPANGVQKPRHPSQHTKKPFRGPKPRNASKAH